MTGKTHLIIGIAASLTLALSEPNQQAIFFIGILAGSLAPDVDHPNSMATRAFPPFRIFSYFFEHRGIFHAAIVPLLIAGAAYMNTDFQASLAGLAIGWALHLLADALTIAGIPVFWPITKLKLGLPIVRTGGIREWILSSALVGLCCYQFYWLFVTYFPSLAIF